MPPTTPPITDELLFEVSWLLAVADGLIEDIVGLWPRALDEVEAVVWSLMTALVSVAWLTCDVGLTTVVELDTLALEEPCTSLD